MLSTNAIYSAINLAEQFDAVNVVLQPLGGSPLHHLVEATHATSDMACKLEDGQVSIDFFRLEQAANAKGSFDASEHDYAFEDFRQRGAQAVRGALSVARNHVAPRIKELLELVTMRLTNAPVSDITKMRISEEEDCPAMYGPNLRQLVDQFANYHNNEPRLGINGGALATAEILKLVETGVASIDEVLIPWAAALPESTLQQVYEDFFTMKNGRDQRGFFGRIDKSQVRMVLVYCIARNLVESDTVLEGADTSLKDYREMLKAIMAQAAHLLAVQMENNDRAIKNGNMVRSVNSNEVRVFPPVYRAWLEQGGDNDVLFGMAVSGKQKFTVDAITAEAATFLQSWRSYSSLITSRDSEARWTFLRDQLVLSYESIINRPNEEGVTPDAHVVKKEMDAFKAVLREMKKDESDNLHSMCLRLVCRTSFADTPAELILSKMDEEIKRNPKLTPREAGALAALWYISDWVASLIVAQTANA